MAEGNEDGLESALVNLVSVTELSGNLKKELKNRILESVSTIRNIFVVLKNELEAKKTENINLVNEVKKVQEDLRHTRTNGPRSTMRQVAPSLGDNTSDESRYRPAVTSGNPVRKLYAEVLRNERTEKRFKLMVKSKNNETGEDTKHLLRTSINPTSMKVGILAMKNLRDGRVLIETGSREEIEKLHKAINEKCCQRLETTIPKLWNPNIVIHNIPEEVTVENAEEIIISQNPDLDLNTGNIKPKFIFTSNKKFRNLVIEVNSQTRKQLLQKKLKIGWLICYAEDYIRINRCFKCCRFNHRARDCRGEETCPKCAGQHNITECTVITENDMKCINCTNWNKYNKNDQINEQHSAMDRNCPSLHAAIQKRKQNIDY